MDERFFDVGKYCAQGNDFLVFLNKKRLKLNAAMLLDRHFGVGADGLIELSHVRGRFKMKLINSDGSCAEISGNGLRAVGYYLVKNALVDPGSFDVLTDVGPREIEVDSFDEASAHVSVKMGQPVIEEVFEKKDLHSFRSITKAFLVDAGNPHLVLIGDKDLSAKDYCEQSLKLLGYCVNIETVYVINKEKIALSVFERGAGETLACGSGTIAASYALFRDHLVKSELSVLNPGGVLEVKNLNSQPMLSGNVEFVGEIKLLKSRYVK